VRSSRRITDDPAPAELSAAWWEGVRITGTAVWCDARRARDICFVSHAYAAEALRHGQLIATRPTLALLARKDRRQQPESQLAVPYGRPFTLGQLRFELFRSGHAAGAASLSLERDGVRAVYAGAVNPRGGGLGGVADVRRCDTLVIDAHYGHPRFAFPDVSETRDAVVAFADETVRAGAVPVLLVTSPAKGLDVAQQITNVRPVRAHRAIHHAAQRLRGEGESVPRLKRWAGKLPRGEVVVWLADSADSPSSPDTRVALVSGEPHPSAARHFAHFPWSNRADHAELVRYIAATGARRVFAVGRYADYLAGTLDNVTALGPARQLNLF
jgi:putative mRNA 3-end processing factor